MDRDIEADLFNLSMYRDLLPVGDIDFGAGFDENGEAILIVHLHRASSRDAWPWEGEPRNSPLVIAVPAEAVPRFIDSFTAASAHVCSMLNPPEESTVPEPTKAIHESHRDWLVMRVCQACGAWSDEDLAAPCTGDVRAQD
jgi:hypothetical protein